VRRVYYVEADVEVGLKPEGPAGVDESRSRNSIETG
jgi:hypothetical protein